MSASEVVHFPTEILLLSDPIPQHPAVINEVLDDANGLFQAGTFKSMLLENFLPDANMLSGRLVLLLRSPLHGATKIYDHFLARVHRG